MVVAEDGLAGRLGPAGGAVALVLIDASDEAAALQAMRRARDEVGAFPHPEEPEDPLPNYVSHLVATPRGPGFWFDAGDALVDVELAGELVTRVLGAMNRARLEGTLCLLDEPLVGDSLPAQTTWAADEQAALLGRVLEFRDWFKSRHVEREQVADYFEELAVLQGAVLGTLLEGAGADLRGAGFTGTIGGVSDPTSLDDLTLLARGTAWGFAASEKSRRWNTDKPFYALCKVFRCQDLTPEFFDVRPTLLLQEVWEDVDSDFAFMTRLSGELTPTDRRLQRLCNGTARYTACAAKMGLACSRAAAAILDPRDPEAASRLEADRITAIMDTIDAVGVAEGWRPG